MSILVEHCLRCGRRLPTDMETAQLLMDEAERVSRRDIAARMIGFCGTGCMEKHERAHWSGAEVADVR